MIEELVAGFVVAVVSAAVGFMIKSRFFVVDRYLPRTLGAQDKAAYAHLDGEWHEYHLTSDPKVGGGELVAHCATTLSLNKDLIVTGHSRTLLEHRRQLTYDLRGQINAGRLYYTAVCEGDPSDTYCAVFGNLLDDELFGVITGWDYAKQLYAAPIMLGRRELTTEEADKALRTSLPQFFGSKAIVADRNENHSPRPPLRLPEE